MAGHSHAANIKHRKSAQDAKRSEKFTKLVNTVYTAAKNGSSDVNLNSQLRFAIEQAREASVPKDKIENAIKRASGIIDGQRLEYIRYNASLRQIAFIIECLTTNRNRTAGDVRFAVSKYNANIVDSGGIEFMFDNVGLITYNKLNVPEEEILEEAMNSGCIDFTSDNNDYKIFTNKSELHSVSQSLIKKYSNPASMSLIWKPKDVIILENDSDKEQVQNIIDLLESYDDVHEVFTNVLL